MESYFSALDTLTLRDSVIFIDIDGTMVPDGEEEPSLEAVSKVKELASLGNHVYLSSNHRDVERNKRMAALVSVGCVESLYLKPSARFIEAIERKEGKPLVVIGDKFLTDGLFARNIGARFIKVKRLRSAADNAAARFLYAADDGLWKVWLVARQIRVRQWVKNLLVFAPVFFAGEIFTAISMWGASRAFLAFSFAASAGYIMNDIADLEADMRHPVKRYRPLAAGLLTIREGAIIAGVLVIGAIVAGLSLPPLAFMLLVFYGLLNAAYSAYLKRQPVLDIVTVAAFYLLRVAVGGAAIRVPISSWLVLCVLFGSLLLVTGKRIAEFGRSERRSVLDAYTAPFLEHLLSISAALVLLSYGIYSVLEHPEVPIMVYSVIPVLVGILRYVSIVHDSTDAEFPEQAVFRDQVIFGSFLIWFVSMAFVFYGSL